MPLLARRGPGAKAACLRVLLVLSLAVLEVQGQKERPPGGAPRRRKSRYNAESKLVRFRMVTYMRLVKYIFLCLLSPVILSFAYSLCTDPAVPELLRATRDAVYKRFLDNVSKQPAHARPNDAGAPPRAKRA